MRTKRIFISDIHIGINEKWSWFQNDSYEKHELRLISFLEWIYKQNDVKDLVLLGDIFDTWVHPCDEEPITIDDIFNEPSNVKIFDAINTICDGKKINVLYVNGNHDQDVTENDIIKKFPNMIYAGTQYDSRPVFAEHGHNNDLFNSSELSYKYPIGYFITRLLTKKNGNNISFQDVLKSSIDDIFEFVFTDQTLSKCVFEAVMEEAKVNSKDEIKMFNSEKITCQQVKEKYSDIYRTCKNKNNISKSFRMITGNLCQEWFAERIAKKKKYKAIVMGHTHETEIDKDTRGVNHVYVNSGCWIKNEPPSLVIVDKNDNKKDITVSNCLWENNELKIISSKEV